MARITGIIVIAAVAIVTMAGCNSTVGSSGSDRRTISREPAPSATHPSSLPPASTPVPSASPPSSPTTGTAGIEGTTVTTRCPVVTDPPCPTTPVPAHIVVTDGTGATIASLDSGKDGHFRVTVKPGSYTLRATATAGLPRPVATKVNVRAGQVLRVMLEIDSGIR